MDRIWVPPAMTAAPMSPGTSRRQLRAFRAIPKAGNSWGAGTKIFSHGLTTYTSAIDSNVYSYTNPTLVRSAGLEFRFFLPISPAPLRLIWSRKLNPYPFDTESKTDFQFSIGTTF